MRTEIVDIHCVEVLDSRGNPTISVLTKLSDGSSGMACVPSGASTGKFEALELRDGDRNRYLGRGVTKAVGNINEIIAPELKGKDATKQDKIDNILLDLDGTKNKEKLGANSLLGVSLSVAYAAASSLHKELYEYLNTKEAFLLPVPLVNVINGGAHARNNIDIQEFMIVPQGAKTFSQAVQMATEIFHILGSLLSNAGYETNLGDEGGYAPSLSSIEQAFDFLLLAIERAGYKPAEDCSIALDIASSELVETSSGKAVYRFLKSKGQDETYSASDLISIYEGWLNKYPIISIEDGLSEEDWQGWAELTNRLGKKIQLVGDDLFVTNIERIARGIEGGVANSVLIKPNQIGTLTETLEAIEKAKQNSYATIISHRSGETSDTTIADIAVATNAGQIKTGSMSRGERISKYNRLLWIEDKLGTSARYVNAFKK
jgi:enolase